MKSPSLVYKAKSNLLALLIFFFGATLVLINFLLVQQIERFRVLAKKPDRALEVKPGTALPALEGVDNNGNKHTFSYGQDSRKTILFVLSPQCEACEENMPNWGAIINGIDRRSYRLAGVSLQSQGFREYASRHGISQVPILTKIDPKYRVTYNLALTPQTILIDADGKVEKVWTGILRGEDKQNVERALNVHLP